VLHRRARVSRLVSVAFGGGGSPMSHPLTFRFFASCTLVTAATVYFIAAAGPARPADDPPPSGTTYHTDPKHLWNRLHDSLFVRVGPDSRVYGQDRFEPLLWPGSKHLLAGDSHDRAIALLNEFVEKQGEKLIDDPLKRAALQRDLWLVFNWLAQNKDSIDKGSSRKRLGIPVSKVIRRLALTPEQIARLPDNYANAVKSGRFAKGPGKPYLPPDLFSDDGPWVCVGRKDGPVAKQHVAEANRFANSTFLIFLRMPEGRDAALKFLKQDRALPAGAVVVLLRRALLIDSKGEVTPTNLTESIQVRVYGGSEQHFEEFRLSRSLLFAGKQGGLVAVGDSERDFKTGFATFNSDPFEEPPTDQPFDVRKLDIKNECRGCHAPDRFPGLRSRESGALSPVRAADAMETAGKWKRERPDYKALRKLLAE
jgi:hypothetical protein